MAARASRERRRGASPAAGGAGAQVLVGVDERRHLIEDCAFFRAEQYREVEPGAYRRKDLAEAAAEVDAAIGLRKKRARKP